jgi:hypothetical protein
MPLDIETDTNQVFRRKYFVNAHEIVGRKPEKHGPPPKPQRGSIVIDASRVRIADKPVVLNEEEEDDDQIQVEMLRENGRIVGIKINCPCGRETILDVTYDAAAQAGSGG